VAVKTKRTTLERARFLGGRKAMSTVDNGRGRTLSILVENVVFCTENDDEWSREVLSEKTARAVPWISLMHRDFLCLFENSEEAAPTKLAAVRKSGGRRRSDMTVPAYDHYYLIPRITCIITSATPFLNATIQKAFPGGDQSLC
jgi:hypothetical protein